MTVPCNPKLQQNQLYQFVTEQSVWKMGKSWKLIQWKHSLTEPDNSFHQGRQKQYKLRG